MNGIGAPRSATSERIAGLLVFLAGVAVAIAYSLNLGAGPFGDDFGWIRIAAAAREHGLMSVWSDAYGCFFFRPMNTLALAVSLELASWAPAHGAVLALHVLLAIAVGMVARRLVPGDRSPWMPALAGGVFFIHQGGATAVLGLDTVSQCVSDGFSLLAVMAGIAYAHGRIRWLVLTAVASLLAALGKEGGVSTPLAVVVTVFFFAPHGKRWRRAGWAALAGLVADSGYLLWRANVRDLGFLYQEARERYHFGLGPETLENLGQFVFIQTVPWNSGSLIWHRRPLEWIAGILLALAAGIVVVAGWRMLLRRHPEARTTGFWLASVFLVWCMPFIFLTKVSEQEVYRLAIPTAILLAAGFSAFWRTAGRNAGRVALLVWAAWIGVSAVASVQKAVLIRDNAAISTSMLEEVTEAVGGAAGIHEVWVEVSERLQAEPYYSVLHVPKPLLRGVAVSGLPEILGHPDLRMRYFFPGQPVPDLPDSSWIRIVRVDLAAGTARPGR